MPLQDTDPTPSFGGFGLRRAASLTPRLFSILAAGLLLTLSACAGPPQASGVASVTAGQAPLKVTFTNNSSNADMFQWDFGDGTTTTTDKSDEVVTHNYTKAGAYTTILTATRRGDPPETSTITFGINVQAGPLDNVTIEPATPTLSVTQAQQFTVTALDQFDNSIRGLTFAFQSDEQAGQVDSDGNFTAGTEAAIYQDAVTVEVIQGAITRTPTADITILPGPLDNVLVTPGTITLNLGGTQEFAAAALDAYDNSIPEAQITWEVVEGAGTIDAEGLLATGTLAATFDQGVKATARLGAASVEGVASLIVNPGPLDSVSLNTVEVAAGERQQLEAVATDRHGNLLEALEVIWTVLDGKAGSIARSGLLTAGEVAGAFADSVEVQATQGELTRVATASVTITAGPPSSLVVQPAEVPLDIGATQSFALTTLDEFGNEISAALASWSVAPEVGTIDGNGTLTVGTRAGAFPGAIRVEVVQGTARASADADVTIRPDPLATIEIQPSSALVTTGAIQRFTAAGLDQYGNVIPELAFLWEAMGGNIDQEGGFTASDRYGRYEVTASTTLNEIQRTGAADVSIMDENLLAAIKDALGEPAGAEITAAELAALTQLDARGARISNLSGIEFGVNLTTLILTTNQISDISALASLTNLTRLELHGNQITDISPLTSLTYLTRLEFWENQISDISPLASLTNLTRLELHGNQITDISPLTSLTYLTGLEFWENQISDISPLASLTNLTRLELHGNQITDISPLTSLTYLTRLEFWENQISDISPLASLTNLSYLQIGRTSLNDISPLAPLTNLTTLHLLANQISDISPLASLTNLTTLHLLANQISDISPLVENVGLGQGDAVFFRTNNLDLSAGSEALQNIAQLEDRGVTVFYQ